MDNLRRRMLYLEQRDIPSTAQEWDGTTDITGDTLYIPNIWGDEGSVRIVSAVTSSVTLMGSEIETKDASYDYNGQYNHIIINFGYTNSYYNGVTTLYQNISASSEHIVMLFPTWRKSISSSLIYKFLSNTQGLYIKLRFTGKVYLMGARISLPIYIDNESDRYLDKFVDLGLPSGRLWAKGNLVKDVYGDYSIGTETDAGVYVSWANVVGHNVSEGYAFSSSVYNSTSGSSKSSDISSYDATYDIVCNKIGYPCHLPTLEDVRELCDYTDREWIDDYNNSGVSGYKIMKQSDHSVYIFIPAAGYCGSNGSQSKYNEQGQYWTSSLYTSNTANSYRMYFTSQAMSKTSYTAKYNGLPIRPVR